MTAEKKMAPRVSGSGKPQEKEKGMGMCTSEDVFLDTVDGAFLSAWLQHALESLSGPALTYQSECKTNVSGLPSKSEADQYLPFSQLGSANASDPRDTLKTCRSTLGTTLDYPSTRFSDEPNSDVRQLPGPAPFAEGPTGANVPGDHVGVLGIVCGSDEKMATAKGRAKNLQSNIISQAAFITGDGIAGDIYTEKARCHQPGRTSAAPKKTLLSQVALPPPGAPLSKVSTPSCNGTAPEVFRDMEAVEASAHAESRKLSETVELYQRFPPLGAAEIAKANPDAVADAATAVGAPCSSLVLFHRPTPTTPTASVKTASLKVGGAKTVRQVPFHMLLSCPCEIPEVRDCKQGNCNQSSEIEASQTDCSKLQQASEGENGKGIYVFSAKQPATFTSDPSLTLQQNCDSNAFNERTKSALQGHLSGRPSGGGERSMRELPGALLQQQSIARALLTRLSSLQAQQALLGYTGTALDPPRRGQLYHLLVDQGQLHSPPEKIAKPIREHEEGLELSQQFSHCGRPQRSSNKEHLFSIQTHLQHPEILSMVQNHTTCVLHFVMRALSLLASCCPYWAADGDELAHGLSSSSLVYNCTDALTAAGSEKTPCSASAEPFTSKENDDFTAILMQESGEPFERSSHATRTNATSLGKIASASSPSHHQKRLLKRSEKDGSPSAIGDASERSRLIPAAPGALRACARVSSYRWHWMHAISFQAHPELLSVYHATLAPLLSLFVTHAQSGSGKRCSRIESLDTSSSHDDELPMPGEYSNDKASPSAAYRSAVCTVNNSCCGAGSWLMVRQVLCDLDDLRVLHDSSFSPCTQRQDAFFCAPHLQQQHMRLGFQSHHPNCTGQSQNPPLCCGTPRCNERCPGAFYCGTALLRSSVLFASFSEAAQALALWPQYLATAAAAALPSGSGLRGRSAFLTSDECYTASKAPSKVNEGHKWRLFTEESKVPAVEEAAVKERYDQPPGGVAKSNGIPMLKRRAELTDAARGVAACILKHVDLNKLDSTELLALLKLTEEANSPSPLSPCEELHNAGVEIREANSLEAQTATATPAHGFNLTHVNICLHTPPTFVDVISPTNLSTAPKQSRDAPEAGLDAADQTQQRLTASSGSIKLSLGTGGKNARLEPTLSGGKTSCVIKGCENLSPLSNRAIPAEIASTKAEVTMVSLVADGNVLPPQRRESLLRFSPLFSPRKQLRSRSGLSTFDDEEAINNEVRAVAVGQQQQYNSFSSHLSPALCDLLCPASFRQTLSCVGFSRDVDSFLCRDVPGEESHLGGRVRPPVGNAGNDPLTETASAAARDAKRSQPPSSAAANQNATVSHRDSISEESLRAAVKAAGDQSCKQQKQYNGVNTLMEFQRGAAFGACEPSPVAPDKPKPASRETAIHEACNADLLGDAVAFASMQCIESKTTSSSGTKQEIIDEKTPLGKAGETTAPVSALDIIEHERALSLVAAGVRNTRKRFRLQSVRRKPEAHLHYEGDRVILPSSKLLWENNKLTQTPFQRAISKQQNALIGLQSSLGSTFPARENSQRSTMCRLANTRLGSVLPSGGSANCIPAASVNNSTFHSACNVRSPVKGIYYDSYKKLWRVQWNSSSGVPAQPSSISNVSLGGAAQGGGGRRVSRSFSCARLGFEAAKARAVAWMLSGGQVGNGALSDVLPRGPYQGQASNSTQGKIVSSASGASRILEKHEKENYTSDPSSEVRLREKQELDEREQKEKLLFANPKLFLEKVEAFYVRNGLYGLQCGNGPTCGSQERPPAGSKEGQERQHGVKVFPSAVSQAGGSRKGNGGTGGLRIVSVLSLDDMLDIVRGRKTTMGRLHASSDAAMLERQDREGNAEVRPAASCERTQKCQRLTAGQPFVLQEEALSVDSQSRATDPASRREPARKKLRTGKAEMSLDTEDREQPRLPTTTSEERNLQTDAAAAQMPDVSDRFVRDRQKDSASQSAIRRTSSSVLSIPGSTIESSGAQRTGECPHTDSGEFFSPAHHVEAVC